MSEMWIEINKLWNYVKKRKPEKRPTIDYTPASITLNAGTLTGGNVASVQTMFDGNTYDIDEVSATPGYDFEFVFTGVTRVPRWVVVRELYNGSATHYVGIDLYNYTTVAWDTVHTFKDSGGYMENSSKMVPLANAANYTSSGAAIVRLYHYTAGNNAHDIMVDYVGLAH